MLSNGGMEARFNEHRLMSSAIKGAISSLGLTEVFFFNFIYPKTSHSSTGGELKFSPLDLEKNM